jgi:hypothetical protein
MNLKWISYIGVFIFFVVGFIINQSTVFAGKNSVSVINDTDKSVKVNWVSFGQQNKVDYKKLNPKDVKIVENNEKIKVEIRGNYHYLLTSKIIEIDDHEDLLLPGETRQYDFSILKGLTKKILVYDVDDQYTIDIKSTPNNFSLKNIKESRDILNSRGSMSRRGLFIPDFPDGLKLASWDDKDMGC